MGLMHCQYFIASKEFKLQISVTHLGRNANTLADSLSHDIASHFLSIFPQAPHNSTPIPVALADLLVVTKLDWTSLSWSRMFSYIFNQPLPKAQCIPTPKATTGIPISATAPAISPFLLQRPSPANSSASLDSTSSSTKPSKLTCTCPTSASSTLSTMEVIPSSRTYPGSSIPYAASNPKK